MASSDNSQGVSPRIELAHEPSVRLGRLLVEPGLRRVVRDDGQEEFLEPRVMQLFVAFLRAEGRILSRDELIVSCWEGRIVGDDAINRTLSRLRRVAEGLGESMFKIETIARVGYRLITEGAPHPGAKPPPGRRIDRRTILAAGSLAAVAAAGGTWYVYDHARSVGQSIAVLPFANLSGDPRQAYFSDGIAEELRSALSRIRGLKVAGRISSEAVRHDDAVAAAKKLNVATILTGSVRRDQGVVRIASQLIDGSTGLSQWSESYDRPEGNVLSIQTEIAQQVVNALRATLSGAMPIPVSIGGTTSAAAHDLYLRALHQAANDDSEDSLKQANALLDVSLANDPRYAEALAAKARNLSYLADLGRSPGDIARGYALAVSTARQAITLKPQLSEGYAALADALYGQRRISAAGRQIDIGLRFAPNDLQLLQAAVVTRVAAGQIAAALDDANRMIALDPLNPLPHRRRYYALFYAGRYDECIVEALKTRKLAPTLALPAYFIALSLIMKNRPEAALPYLATMPPDLTVRLAAEAIVASRLGDLATSDGKLNQLRSVYGDAASYQFAQAYAQRGDAPRALNALNRGFAVNDPGLNTLPVDPLFTPLRGNPAFTALLRRVDVK